MLGMAVVLRLLAGSLFRKYSAVLVGAAAAWSSHFLLDALYADSHLAILWPISGASVSLPVPWLKTMPHAPPPFDRQILLIFLFEALTFLPLLVFAAVFRRSSRTVRI
jgi:hypothetical protein